MKKVLITNLCGIGDLIRMEPIVRGVRKKFPESYIAFLTREGRDQAYLKNLDIDDIFVFPDKKCNQRIIAGDNPLEVLRDEVFLFCYCLREMAFDLVIAPPHYTDEILNGLMGAKEYCGAYANEWQSPVIVGEGAEKLDEIMKLNSDERKENNTENLTNLFLDVCRELELPLAESEKIPRFSIGVSDRLFSREFFKERMIQKEDHLFVFHFGSRGPEKRWTQKKAAQLADRCIETFGVKILFGGSKEEYETYTKDTLGMMRHAELAVGASGRTSFTEYASLIKRANLLVTTDSASLHLADCFGIPIVGLFGGNYPNESRPSHENHRLIVRSSMEEIDVGEVFKRIEEFVTEGLLV